MRHVLITGAAGFTGSHTVERLLAQADFVTGIDNFDSSEPFKDGNISKSLGHRNFRFIGADLRTRGAFTSLKAGVTQYAGPVFGTAVTAVRVFGLQVPILIAAAFVTAAGSWLPVPRQGVWGAAIGSAIRTICFGALAIHCETKKAQ